MAKAKKTAAVEQTNEIPKPYLMIGESGHVRVVLPNIPLYGRYNPIPRGERKSKITGKPFPTSVSRYDPIKKKLITEKKK